MDETVRDALALLVLSNLQLLDAFTKIADALPSETADAVLQSLGRVRQANEQAMRKLGVQFPK
jgi:hypothetical protein